MCAIERSNRKAGVGQILKLYLEYFSSYVHFNTLTQNLNIGVNDNVRTDSDLHKGSNLGMGVYCIERPYPMVGVGQVSKQYLKQLKTMHTFENFNIVLTRTPTDANANNWVAT